MRDYSKVTPAFWTGQTGQKLRGKPELQVLAAYLMTNRHANMIGVYELPAAYAAHETGLPLEGAQKGLRSLSKEGFCTLDIRSDLIWVVEMARVQVGDRLKITDNQVKGVAKQFATIPKSLIKWRFFQRYRDPFHLVWTPEVEELQRSYEAPSKSLRSQEQEQEHYPSQESKDSLARDSTTSTGASAGAGAPGLKVVA